MRYLRQGYEIRVPFGNGRLDNTLLANIQHNFEEQYIRFYGRLCEGVSIQAVNWRVVVAGPKLELEAIHLAQAEAMETDNKPIGSRPVLFAVQVGMVDTAVYHRYTLTPNHTIPGPAIIEEAESTTVVPPGWAATTDPTGCLILTKTANKFAATTTKSAFAD